MRTLAPEAISLLTVRSLLSLLFAFVAVMFFVFPLAFLVAANAGFTVLALVGVACILFLWFVAVIIARLSYRAFWYDLTPEGISIQSGIIFRKNVVIPYARVQNIDIYRGPLLRLYGLAEVRIQTAGSAIQTTGWGRNTAEGTIPGVLDSDAEAIRKEILQRSQKGDKGL